MPQCAVLNCNNTHRKTKGGPVRYHRFPGDVETRARWVKACGRHVQNCSTARICSRHFSDDSYERDVQHELLGLPTRCRLRKGAVPDSNLPNNDLDENETTQQIDSAIAVLLAVGLVPATQSVERINGGLPQDLNKMHIMDEVREGCDTQPSSPGHAEQRIEIDNDDLKEKEDLLIQTAEMFNNESDDAKIDVNREQSNKSDVENEMLKTSNSDESENKIYENLQEEIQQEEIDNNHMEEEDSSIDSIVEIDEHSKRKSTKIDTSSNKKLKTDIESNFNIREKIFQQYIDTMGCNNLEQIHLQTDQLLAEIRTLHELAKEKEKEWNNIIHMKKMKEELLLRLQRQKQIILMNDKNDTCDVELVESSMDYQEERKSILKPKFNIVSRKSKTYKKNNDCKPTTNYSTVNHQELNGGQQQQNKQRNVVDVQSIIADYRQRHPETVPRRGRRIRSVLNTNSVENGNKIGVLSFANIALGSGSQVKQNVTHNLDNAGIDTNVIINPMEGLKGVVSSSEYYGRHTQDVSFKDMLVQCAKLSQNERQDGVQNQSKGSFPEVTVHPVTTPSPQPTNSLLHGILTKAQSKTDSSKSTFSPTLARLLTAPERSAAAAGISNPGGLINNPNVSISDILSCSKARNEITITPVNNQYETNSRGKNVDEEEADDSVDRLVIDEGGEIIDARTRTDNGSDAGDEVPQCQGCNQKAAQFVCAGCGNQWYCSRECQVAAWDEHSEVCSG